MPEPSVAPPADAPVEKRWSSCPACASPGRRPFVAFDQVEFMRCDGCGLVYKVRELSTLRPDDFYEKAYFHGRKSGRDKRFEHRVRKCMRQIRMAAGVQPISRVVDIGCSFGYVIEAAKRLGLEAAGTDISEYAVEVCRKRGYRAEVGTLDHLPFADGEFDLVVMKHVLEHTPEPKAALKEVARILAPGGLIMIMVPSLRYWKAWLLRRSYRYFRPDDLGSQHYFYCTPKTLQTLTENGGFDLVCRSKAFFRPRGLPGPVEWLRYAALWLWQRAALGLYLQREAFAIVRRKA